MAMNQKKFDYGLDHTLRDTRPLLTKVKDYFADSTVGVITLLILALVMFIPESGILFADLIFLIAALFFWWEFKHPKDIIHKMPASSPYPDGRNTGGGRSGKAEGILYLGNADPGNEEIWFTNEDARTHVLYLGTTGSGKTEGLKSMVANAMTWSSGFIYVDGKADTDLWSSLSAMARRFGRDDDLLVLNYMTGNSDARAASNSMNPFSSGSASYLSQMLVSLMPEAEGDNAMWKERAVALLSSLMPALTYQRDHLNEPLNIGRLRRVLNFSEVIKLSRDERLPERIRESIKGYLDTLPGYVDEVFDDNGKQKPMGPDQPMVDIQVPQQQHGYLSMQFTRALQSLGDDYGYIFDVENADVDMKDIVLNRRILVVLIPALEKSTDETANLGKIVASTLKGMMGGTLGANVEGEAATTIDNKPTNSATPFMTVFDEVGYYTAPGMAVMAAQARSLGFCLIYAAQDLPAMEKRIKEEARSITANCNIKIFGKLEDPSDTKEFFEKTIGQALVTEVSSFSINSGSLTGSYLDAQQASVQLRPRSSYDSLKKFKEGQAVLCFAEVVNDAKMFYANPGKAAAMRVQRYLALDKMSDDITKHIAQIQKLRDCLVNKEWSAEKADISVESTREIDKLADGLDILEPVEANDPLKTGALALTAMHLLDHPDALDQAEALAKPKEKSQPKAEKPQSAAASSEAQKAPNQENSLTWANVINGDVLTDDDGDEDDEEEGSGSGSSAVNPDYSAQDAVEKMAREGVADMPDNLSDAVKDILKSAADSLSAGLFSLPTISTEAGTGAPTPPRQPPTSPAKT